MQTTSKKNEFIYHTHDPRYGPKYAASSKNGKLFLADFSDFYLAVSASVNDANYRRPNSFITPMTRDYGPKYAVSSKNGKLFLADFSDFYLAVSASVNDANYRRPFIYHTHDPRYGPKYAASSKNGKLFLADFFDFYLAVSASVNDANYRKPNSFITPMTRDMDRNMLLAVKTENFFSSIFLILIWL